ncbi:MAG: flippase activity-associated protein Agl23 [Haloarculaceae archaeon]
MSSRSERVSALVDRGGRALRGDRTVQAVLLLAVLGALLRLPLLGRRIAHFDEGRVNYWTLHFLETGEFHYRYIIHGPFVQHVDRVLFAVLGPTDFAARLPIAVVGSLLPLAALLFRERLRDVEVAALAGFLALNPLLLYYSRFMRSTLLVAGFSFVAFGLFVRAIDTGRRRYAYAGAFAWALAFAAKENALVYLLCWLGASALLLDHWLFRPGTTTSGFDRLRGWYRGVADRPDDRIRPIPEAALLVSTSLLVVGAVTLFFYAPRSPDGGVGLWSTVFAPWTLPELVDATVADITTGLDYWFGRPGETENLASTYRTRLGKFVGVGTEYAAALAAFAVAGTVLERYVADRPRLIVMFAAYWGFVSVLGYPLGTDIWAAWIIVNAVVPLAIPAAVGLGVLLRTGRDAYVENDTVSVAAAGLILLVIVGQAGVAAATGVYTNTTSADNRLVQFAQPSQEMRPSVDEMAAVAAANDGTDALVYGEPFVDGDTDGRAPPCVKWFEMLPYPWYLEAHDVQVTCAMNESQLPDRPPPVIIVQKEDYAGEVVVPRSALEYVPESYEQRTFQLRTTAKQVAVFVDPERRPD